MKKRTKRNSASSTSSSLKLKSIKFSEFLGEEREWILDKCTFNEVSLIVGRNASGKSRILNVISGLTKMLCGEVPRVFSSGDYEVSFFDEISNSSYDYKLVIEERKVVKEVFEKDGIVRLNRGKQGEGQIFSQTENKMIMFEAPPEQLAAKNRRDKIQHPFFEELNVWAKDLRHYQFGTPMGRESFMNVPSLAERDESKNEDELKDANLVCGLYRRMYQEFGKKFDESILRDLSMLGYKCSDVGAEVFNLSTGDNQFSVMSLFVKEKGIKTKVHQLTMSQGMFRALSLVIQLNYILFRGIKRTVLIDDIGEGLDFSRSKSFVSMLVEKAVENGVQLLMTTNDRFIMNGVPLKYWGVVNRSKNRVHVINKSNSPKTFEDYEHLGLNNFEFFSTDFFVDGLK